MVCCVGHFQAKWNPAKVGFLVFAKALQRVEYSRPSICLQDV